MASVILPFGNNPGEIAPGSVIRSGQVMSNFQAIVDAINGGIDSVNLAPNAVSESRIATGAVTVDKLGSNAVTTVKINNGAVTTVKIEDGAITPAKTSGLTAHRAVVSDGDGRVATSAVTATELGYLSGVSGPLQGQIENLEASLPLYYPQGVETFFVIIGPTGTDLWPSGHPDGITTSFVSQADAGTRTVKVSGIPYRESGADPNIRPHLVQCSAMSFDMLFTTSVQADFPGEEELYITYSTNLFGQTAGTSPATTIFLMITRLPMVL